MTAEEGCWSNLPSIIVVEIFSYLSWVDKVSASTTCKNWRNALFHPTFWQSINFKAKMKDQSSVSRTRYLTNCFARNLRHAVITFDSMDYLCVKEAARVLQKLCGNENLRRLFLVPSHCRCECPGRENDKKLFFEKNVLKPLQALVQQSRRLEALSFGCSEDLACYSGPVLSLLSRHQAGSLRCLQMASVKDDPDDYLLSDLDPTLFRSFKILQVLSLDYDYVSDSLLNVLGDIGLVSFIIHVHGIEDTHPGTTDAVWNSFAQRSPRCELQITLIHSYDAIEVLHSDILRRSMPLTHLKAFFCEQLNCHALHLISSWYCRSLRSLWLVDSVQSPSCHCLVMSHDEQVPPDPLVMIAWRCTNLQELVLIGYKYFDQCLIAIARLRGETLQRLDIAAQDIVDETNLLHSGSLQMEVSEAMGKSWAPLADSELHDVIHNPTAGDSDEFILPLLLQETGM